MIQKSETAYPGNWDAAGKESERESLVEDAQTAGKNDAWMELPAAKGAGLMGEAGGKDSSEVASRMVQAGNRKTWGKFLLRMAWLKNICQACTQVGCFAFLMQSEDSHLSAFSSINLYALSPFTQPQVWQVDIWTHFCEDFNLFVTSHMEASFCRPQLGVPSFNSLGGRFRAAVPNAMPGSVMVPTKLL